MTFRLRGITLCVACLLASVCAKAQDTDTPLTPREKMLLERIEQLEKRLSALEAKETATPVVAVAAPPQDSPTVVDQKAVPAAPPADSSSLPGFLAGTTLNFNLDTYYGYNFNDPVGRVNLLRSNDTLSNSFSLGQADMIIERAPDPAKGRRFGMRIDLMFGQNTETLQGSPFAELRPQVYRNIWQAYGTYVLPIGSGLTVDFGKFASSLGYEGNYTKDQLNYSRSFYFIYLPFYHTGARVSYKFNNKLSFQYLLVNGANQAEDFNTSKSNGFLFTVTPAKAVTWNVNYYFGEENQDVVANLNPGPPVLPTQPGLSTTPILPTPNGKDHIFDTYATWHVTPKLAIGAEADYVIHRYLSNSSPGHVAGGVGYLKYQVAPKFALAGRVEYLADHGGIFTDFTQIIREGTVTATYQPVDGFQVRWEYRRDTSTIPFYLTSQSDLLKRYQDTATMGLVWWFGGKQGSW